MKPECMLRHWSRYFRSIPSLAAAILIISFCPLAAEDDQLEKLQVAALPADQVIALLEDLTGRTILRQEGIPNPPLSLRMRPPVSRDEAIIAIESLLKLNGIAILSDGTGFLKAVPVAQASRQVPELITGSTLELPATGKIFATVFTPEFLESSELVELISPVLSSEAVQELSRSGGILVTDSLINLQRAETLLLKLDRPREIRESVRFFRMQHVDARQVAERLTALRDGALQAYLGPQSSFSADERTNQLIVVTQRANLRIIEELIEQLDEDVQPLTESHVFYIKHAQAGEIVPLIESLITGQRNADTEDTRTRRTRSPEQAGETPGEEAAPVAAPVPPAAADNGLGDGRRLQFSPYVTLVSDERSNSIVVYGTPSDIRFVGGIIEKIDILLAQVRIEVVIAEVNLRNDRVRGLDVFGLEYNVEGESAIRLARDAEGNELPLRAGGLTLSALAVRDFSLRAVFNAAEDNTDVSVLSAPTIVTTHNREASISVIESRPIVTGTLTDSTGLSTRRTVQFRDIGIELTVTPLIGNDGVIQMEIEQTVENIITILSDSNNPDLDGQPVIGSRRATSFVTVSDQDVIILGGLQERAQRVTHRRLALLGRLPVLGSSLFTRRSLETDNRELMIFIKPHVVVSPTAAGEDAREIIRKSITGSEVREFLESGTLDMEDLERLVFD